MLRIECINDSNSSVLEVGKVYYAFPVPRGEAAYISRFPNKCSNFGCFQINRFIETDKPASAFYTTNSLSKVRQKARFIKGSFYLAKKKNIADKYNPYLYVFAVSEDVLAIYNNESFAYCLGTNKAKSFEKISERKPPEKPGDVNLCPTSLTYGIIMKIGVPSATVKENPVEINEETVCEYATNPSIKFEQLSLF